MQRQRVESFMPLGRFVVAFAALLTSICLAAGFAEAQTKINVGKFVGGSSLHIPSYVAVGRGFFKEEGLDARLVALGGRPLVTAGLSGSVDFVPIPSGGAQAALSGAEILYVVGESSKSHWVFLARPEIAKPEDLKGKTVAYGRAGSADYDEGAAVLLRAFKMRVAKDYKVISFAGEPERIAALVNGNVQAALTTVAQIPKARSAGMKVLVQVGDYLERAGGAMWVRKAFVDKNPEVIPKFIRAMAKATIYYRDNKAGSLPILKEHFGITSDADAETVWNATRATFSPVLTKEQLGEVFEQRRQTMIEAKQWPKDKPLPDMAKFMVPGEPEKTLKAIGWK
jgi:ABC-type nitrate/sulfonate/bicarbonate transport system substrate-binding protein